MARPLRVDYSGAWHHVMNRGARRQAIYLTDDDRYRFLELLSEIEERYGVAVNAFCMLGNHYHLLAQSKRGELSRAMRHVDGVFAQRFNREHGLDGPLFRGRFTSRLVEEGDYLRQLLRYIHRNPVEAGLVEQAELYPWSSLQYLLGPATRRPGWLRTEALQMSGIVNRRDLLKLMAEDRSDLPDAGDLSVPFYGSERFVDAHLRLLDGSAAYPASDLSTLRRPSFGEVVAAVSGEWSVPEAEVLDPRPGRKSDARTMAIGLVHEVGGRRLSEVAAAFGLAHERSAGSRTDTYRQMMGTEGFAEIDLRVRQRLVGDTCRLDGTSK